MYNRIARAFTLIELLVVIAIIAILAAILFPVFAKARERAKLSACISNQRQLALAVHTYADDNDGLMPHCIAFSDGNGQEGLGDSYKPDGSTRLKAYSLLYRKLHPYVKNDEIFVCPSDKSAQENASKRKDEVTYRFNPYGSGFWWQDGQDQTKHGGTAGPFRPLSISLCRRPSEFALFRERYTDFHWAQQGNLDYSKRRSPLAMVDGSVKMRAGGTPATNDPAPWNYMNYSFWWTGNEPWPGSH